MTDFSTLKVAIVHYWLVGMRGGEKVLEELCTIFPQAEIFTHVVDPDVISPVLREHRIHTTFINRLPAAKRFYKKYLPLMPSALERLDLRGFDLIISSESGPAKGIIPPPGCLHICYCHTPMRYIWNMYHEYKSQAGWLTRMLMPPICLYLRKWDKRSADRVDYFIANSKAVQDRITNYYNRDSKVIHPPVATETFSICPDRPGDFYLVCGQLTGYKRVDLAIEAFNQNGKSLVIIGKGEMQSRLQKIAQANIKFLGSQSFEVLLDHYQRCRALIFPGEEDFGIVPVEAMACGRPVIAYGRGGILDTVINGVTGLFFTEQTVQSLNEAIQDFEANDHFNPTTIQNHTLKFSKEIFRQRISDFIHEKQAKYPKQSR